MSGAESHTPWRVRRHVLLAATCLIFLFAAIGGWLYLARISGAVVARGQLARFPQNSLIQHPEGGRVSQVLVKEGDQVHVGQALIQLDTTRLKTEISLLENRLFELQARKARLMAERDGARSMQPFPADQELSASDPRFRKAWAGQHRLFEVRLAAMKQEAELLQIKAGQVSQRIQSLKSRQDAIADAVRLASNALDTRMGLAQRGLATQASLQDMQRDLFTLRANLAAAQAEQATAGALLADMNTKKLQLMTNRREDAISQLRDLDLRLNDVIRKRSELHETLAQRTIRAPVSGIVLGLGHYSAGTVIKPAAGLMQIVPSGLRYYITAAVGPDDVSRLRPGQSARLRFSTLGPLPGPEWLGAIRRLSPDARAGQNGRGRYYRVEISLPETAQAALKRRGDVLPGIPVEVFLETGSQPAWAYLFGPFRQYAMRTFRER